MSNWETGELSDQSENLWSSKGSTPEIFSVKAIISPKNPIGMNQIVGGLKNNFFLIIT